MESIFILLLLAFGWTIFKLLIGAGAKTAKAAAKATFGNGTFSENLDLEFKGIGPMTMRLVEGNSDKVAFREVQVKGLFPITSSKNLRFVTSIFDDEEGNDLAPIVCYLDEFQEEHSVCYQTSVDIGRCEPNSGYIKWVKVGVVLPEIMQGPHSGLRKLRVLLRLVDINDPPLIENGFHTKGNASGIIWSQSDNFTWNMTEKGYVEIDSAAHEAKSLTVKIAVAIAMADGNLDDAEGMVLKEWILKAIAPYTDSKREELKALYNSAMKDAHTEILSGELLLSELVSRLNDVGSKKAKYETMELCYDVMVADGVADAVETKKINLIADGLELEIEELEKLRDKKLVAFAGSAQHNSSIEDMVGIDSGWTDSQIKKHLRTEFNKWNNRINTLTDEAEIQSAQRMLDMISEAHKKYG